MYRIYSINRPERLLNFWTLRVGAYSRWALIRGWALIKFSPFSGSVVVYFAKSKVSLKYYPEENSVFGRVSYYILLEFLWEGVGGGGRLFEAGPLFE